jgi:hypothetical protein
MESLRKKLLIRATFGNTVRLLSFSVTKRRIKTFLKHQRGVQEGTGGLKNVTFSVTNNVCNKSTSRNK